MKICGFAALTIIAISFSCGRNPDNKSGEKSSDTLKLPEAQIIQQKDSLILEIQKFLSDSALLHASTSILIAEDSLENIIFQHNTNLSLVPASVLKLLTTATALEVLGGDISFKTRLQYTGEIIDGHILKGDVYVKGGGDPTLGRGNQENIVSKWGNAIKELGIDTISGYIIGDASVYEDELACPTWAWGELSSSYCQGASGLSFNDNNFEISFNAKEKGMFLSSESNMKPFVPGLRFNNLSQTADINELETYLLGMPYGNEFDIMGYFPKDKNTFTISGTLPDPTLTAAYQLCFWLRKNGVNVCDTAKTYREIVLNKWDTGAERKEILVTNSASLYSIISETNLVSRNLFAEHILKQLGMKRSSVGNRQSGLNVVAGFWTGKGMNPGGLFLHDGSGLSRFNGITAYQIAFVLSYMKNKSRHYDSFRNTLPEAGKTGTLRRIGKNTTAEGRVFAKSGTMSRVSNYAGYVTTTSGKVLIFVIITNNFSCTLDEIKTKYEKIMTRMAEWRRPQDNLQ